jgi:hypothetical protein
MMDCSIGERAVAVCTALGCAVQRKTTMTAAFVCNNSAERSALFWRKVSFIQRRARFRSAAFRTLLPTENPTRSEAFARVSRKTKQRTTPRRNDCPSAMTREKTLYPRRISDFLRENRNGFTPGHPIYFSSLTVRRRRPFALRRDKTLRPFFVAIRARNPWALIRFLRCG